MDFKELKKELKKLSLDSTRQDEEVYFEAVIMKAELVKLTAALEKHLGPPACSAVGGKITSEMQNTINEFGGIIGGQTLYFFRDGEIKVFAMLWPWQDREHITLKTGKK